MFTKFPSTIGDSKLIAKPVHQCKLLVMCTNPNELRFLKINDNSDVTEIKISFSIKC